MSDRDEKQNPQVEQQAPATEAPAGESAGGTDGRVQFSHGGQLPPVAAASGGAAGATTASDQAYGVHAVAEYGVNGAQGALPHGDKIAASFGPAHAGTVKNIGARVGGRAAEASKALGGAKAYATASQVAFESEPDVHTAAHEAAHVVQQQKGVHLKDGVGKSGDAHEEAADAVADRVVAGKPAGDLLGNAMQGAVTSAVQGLHGDLTTELRPELGGDGQKTVADALAEKDKTSGIKRDKNANNARKVEFEGQLAAAVLRNPHAYAGPVHQTSRNILAYLQRREAQLKISLRDSLMQLGGQSNFFGRLADDITGTNEPIFLAEIQKVLAGGGNIPNHMLIHHQFWTKIYEEQDFAQNKANELLDGVAHHPAFIRHRTKIDVDGAQVNPFDKDQRGRDASVNKPNATAGRAQEEFGQNKVDLVDSASGFAERAETERGPQGGGATPLSQSTEEQDQQRDKTAGLDQSHTRGVDMWTVNESKAFTQKARVALDMPIAAGVSGTTADLMGCAEAIGNVKTKEGKMQYGLAVLGFLGAAGAHSFHEILTVVGAAGGHYEEGNYRGVYPAAFEATPEFAKLRAQYPEFLGGDEVAEAEQQDEEKTDEAPAPRVAVV